MPALLASRFALLLKASWQGAVLVLLVLTVQFLMGSRLNPRWRYALWLLVMVRLALPWTVISRASLFNLVGFRAVSASLSFPSAPIRSDIAVSQRAEIETVPAVAMKIQPSVRISWLHSRAFWLLGGWAFGVLGFSALLFANNRPLSRRIAAQRPLTDAAVLNLLEDCKQEMGVQVPVTLVEIKELGSPTLFGFVRPRLLLPAGITRAFSPEELRYVFLHELSHIKRNDILLGWAMTLLQVLHWFNPLVWLAAHRMRVDRELACDALALSYTPQGQHQRYGETIIKLLENFGKSAWAPSLAGAVENQNQMKERIRMIAKFGKTNRGPGLVVVLFAVLGLVTLTDAQPETAPLGKDLLGTWVLVGTPGKTGAIPAAGGRVKLITAGSWSLTEASAENGATIFHHGGTWAIEDNEYRETVDYANHNTSELLHKTFRFTAKIDGDSLTLIGIGNPWKEVWKRTTPESLPRKKADSTLLQGTWIGQKPGADARHPDMLTVQGSKLEFRASDTNEWYRADFSVFDTNPKQLVATITGCADHAYVGATSFAIYDLQDGTLTITGSEPGSLIVPANFDATDARKFIFKRK